MGIEKPTIVEKLINNLNVDVYPITIIKFTLNKKRILNYMEKASSDDFVIKGKKIKIDNTDCEFCKQKKEEGVADFCRQHTSINRVLNADKVLFDEDTNLFIYKNEIFRVENGKLEIIYCPHTKPISKDITEDNVKKITPITIHDEEFQGLPDYKTVNVLSTSWMNDFLKCWFSSDFSIVTIPHNRNKSNFILTCNS